MGLFRFTSQRFGGESRKPSEERFGEGFPFYGWKFQVLVDFGFQVLKFFGGCDFGESAEKQLVCPLTFHHFQSIQDLAMRRSLPNGKPQSVRKVAATGAPGPNSGLLWARGLPEPFG